MDPKLNFTSQAETVEDIQYQTETPRKLTVEELNEEFICQFGSKLSEKVIASSFHLLRTFRRPLTADIFPRYVQLF